MQGSWVWMLLAVVVMLLGLYVLIRGLRLKNDTLDSSQSTSKNGLPIIPRDERELDGQDVEQDIDQDALSNMAEAMQATPIDTLDAETVTASTDQTEQATSAPKMQTASAMPVVPSEPQVQLAQVDNGFSESSEVLERHLDEQQAYNEANNPLGHYEGMATIVITPQFGAGISGRKVLEISRNYGLRHGAMNMFHRHEMEDGRGERWFSMMAEDSNGPVAFDLNTLADDHFTGLILFLVFPHNQLLRGYDSMVSTANMLARELNAVLTDENRTVMDDESFARMRGILSTH